MKKFISLTCLVLCVLMLFTSCNITDKKPDSDSSFASSDSDKITSDRNSNNENTDIETDDGVIQGGFTQEYEYNDNNQMETVSIYNSDSDLKAKISYEYNENGDTTIITVRDADGNIRIRNEYEYKDDTNGNSYVSRNTYYDSNNKVALYVLYEFSEENNCPITVGYFDVNDKEIKTEDANKIIKSLNAFMYE